MEKKNVRMYTKKNFSRPSVCWSRGVTESKGLPKVSFETLDVLRENLVSELVFMMQSCEGPLVKEINRHIIQVLVISILALRKITWL